MPRLTHRIPKLGKKRRGNVTYAVVRLNNRIHICGRWGTKEADRKYRDILKRWIESGSSPSIDASPRTTTVAQLCAAFWKHAKSYYNATTADHFRRVIKLLRKHYGSALVAEFNGPALKLLRQQFVAAGCTRGYANQQAQRVKQIFRWGVAEDMVPPDVHAKLAAVTGLRKGKGEARDNPPVEPVSLEDFEAAAQHLPTTVADMLRLQLYTGARPGEIRIIRPMDVDMSKPVWEYRPASHKTEHQGKRRVILIGPKGQDVLRPYLLRPESDYCFRPMDSEKKRLRELHSRRKTPLSCGNRPGTNRRRNPKRKPGELYDKDVVNKAVERACKKAKVRKWTAYQLRHTWATLIRQQFGLEAAQVVLGHSRADVTQVYAERDLAKGLTVVEQIG